MRVVGGVKLHQRRRHAVDPTPAVVVSLISATPFYASTTMGHRAATVRVAGELDMTTAPELDQVLDRAGAGGRTVLLDLDETTFVDSAGIRVLLASAQRLTDQGGGVRLIAASPAADRILRLTGVLEAFKEPDQ